MLSPGLHNIDAMQALKEYPDNYFELAIADPPYGEGLASEGGCKGWFAKYHQSPETLGGGKTWNRFGQRFDKYKPQTLHVWTPETGQELREQAEHGRQNTQKNYHVGCGAKTGVFRGTVSRLT